MDAFASSSEGGGESAKGGAPGGKRDRNDNKKGTRAEYGTDTQKWWAELAAGETALRPFVETAIGAAASN